MKSGIYALIENRLGHRFYGMPRYIGQSVNLSKRKLVHFKMFKSNSHHNKYLQRIQNDHFEKGVSLGWVPIVYCHEKDLNYYERELIKLYKNSITNISDGGVDQDIKADCPIKETGARVWFNFGHTREEALRRILNELGLRPNAGGGRSE